MNIKPHFNALSYYPENDEPIGRDLLERQSDKQQTNQRTTFQTFPINRGMIDIFANTTFNYSNTITLSNTLTWAAQTHVVNLDFEPVAYTLGLYTNNDIGWLSTTITANTDNIQTGVNNYTLAYSANTMQTTAFIANSVNPFDRVLLIQTQLTGNTPSTSTVIQVIQANNVLLRIKNSQV